MYFLPNRHFVRKCYIFGQKQSLFGLEVSLIWLSRGCSACPCTPPPPPDTGNCWLLKSKKGYLRHLWKRAKWLLQRSGEDWSISLYYIMRITDNRMGGFSPEGTGPSGASDWGLDTSFFLTNWAFGRHIFMLTCRSFLHRFSILQALDHPILLV